MTQNKSSEKFGEDEVEALLELENFIASNPDPRELYHFSKLMLQ